MLFARSRTEPNVTATPATSEARTAEIASLLAAIAARRPLPEPADLPPILVEAARALDAAMAARDKALLESTVAFSMKASEAMAASARITGEIRETSRRAEAMAAGAEEMSASVQEITYRTNDVAAAMSEATRAMEGGVGATREAAEATRSIGASFAEMSAASTQLSDAAHQIGTFVGTIEGLAQQTNLLALNATIEAARAGEAGRGFAVVASEVKLLSGQTQKATDDIRARIARLDSHVEELTRAVDAVRSLVDVGAERCDVARTDIERIRDVVADGSGRLGEVATVLSAQNVVVGEIAAGIQAISDHAHKADSFGLDVNRSISGCEEMIARQFEEIERAAPPDYVLHRAKSDHFMWKKHLSEALAGLKTIRPEDLADQRNCRLGKWYETTADAKVKAHPAFVALPPVHRAVHDKGREVAACLARGDRAGALAAYAEMDRASGEVVACLDRLITR